MQGIGYRRIYLGIIFLGITGIGFGMLVAIDKLIGG
jgi:hypothetical protein